MSPEAIASKEEALTLLHMIQDQLEERALMQNYPPQLAHKHILGLMMVCEFLLTKL